MRKKFTLLLGMALTWTMSFSQNIVIDNFEGTAKSWKEGSYDASDQFSLVSSTHLTSVANPWSSSLNTSASVGKFTNFGTANIAFSITFSDSIRFSAYPKLTFTALGDVAGKSDTVVAILYNNVAGFKSSIIKTTAILTTSGDWEAFEIKFDQFASKPGYYNTVGFIINPSSTNTSVMYLDNITLVYDAVNTKEVVFNETWGTCPSSYVDTDDSLKNFKKYSTGLTGDVKTEYKYDYYWQEYLDKDGGTDSINTVTRVQKLRPDTAELKIKIFTPWGVQTALQPYKNAGDISVGIYPNTSLYFKDLNIKGFTNIKFNFAFMNQTWNLENGNVEAGVRAAAYARVDGGAWIKLTNTTPYPPTTKQQFTIKAKDGVTDSTVNWYANCQWYYIEHSISLTGSTLDVAIQNPSWGVNYFAPDGVTQVYPGPLNWLKYQVDNVSVSGDVTRITKPNGINKPAEIASVIIYNSHDVVYVKSVKDVSTVTIYDLSGRKVKTTFNTKTVSISSLNKGIYIVNARMADGTTETSKIIK
jgi:hypothetical protein